MASDAPHTTALPGTYVDLIVNGTSITQGRRDVVLAVRRVMLSAHRHGIGRQQIVGLLTDDRNRLAVQVATGRGGRRMSRSKVNEDLAKWWDATATLAATQPVWDRDDALAFIEFVRDAWEARRAECDDTTQRVFDVALQLATDYGSTRPALPERGVAARAGLSQATARRRLRALAADGEWLSLAQRGRPNTGRSNLYLLAPALRGAYLRTSSVYAPPPTYAPPTYAPPSDAQEAPMQATFTFTGTPEQVARWTRLLAQEAEPEQAPAPVIRLVPRAADGGNA